MKKSSIILVCLFLLGCGSAPKKNDESSSSEIIVNKNDEPEKNTALDSLSEQRSNIIQEDILGVRHTYTPPHVLGNKNFSGECDLYSTVTLKVSGDQTKLYIELYFKAKEPGFDKTEASGKERFVVYDTKSKRKKIIQVITGRTDSGRFNYRNDSSLHLIFEPYTVYAEWDMINGVPGGGGHALKLKQRGLANFTKDFTKNGLIRKWVFQGNFDSEFRGASRPNLSIETDTISILVQENK